MELGSGLDGIERGTTGDIKARKTNLETVCEPSPQPPANSRLKKFLAPTKQGWEVQPSLNLLFDGKGQKGTGLESFVR